MLEKTKSAFCHPRFYAAHKIGPLLKKAGKLHRIVYKSVIGNLFRNALDETINSKAILNKCNCIVLPHHIHIIILRETFGYDDFRLHHHSQRGKK